MQATLILQNGVQHGVLWPEREVWPLLVEDHAGGSDRVSGRSEGRSKQLWVLQCLLVYLLVDCGDALCVTFCWHCCDACQGQASNTCGAIVFSRVRS